MKTLAKQKQSSGPTEVLINLAPDEKLALQRHAKKFGIGSSDFVRIALSQYIASSCELLNGKTDLKRKGRVPRMVE